MKADLRVLKTQESLRHALLDLLKEKPLESISVAELCRLAKINRGTFYLHYKDIHGVFESYFDAIVKDLRKSYEEPFFQTNFKIENMKSDMIEIFHHVQKYQRFYEIIFDEVIPLVYYYKLFNTIHMIMKENMKSLSGENEVHLNYRVSYQTNAIIGLLIEWHREGYRSSPADLNNHLFLIIQTASPLQRKGK